MKTTSELARDVIRELPTLARRIHEAPESALSAPPAALLAPAGIHPAVGLGRRYSAPWERPTSVGWLARLASLAHAIKSGGIIAMVGPRGHGKTRLAAEAIRDAKRDGALYRTAMIFFSEIRASYHPSSRQSEHAVIRQFCRVPLLVLDELQVRGDTPAENRALSTIIDERYRDLRPTILIANLTPSEIEKTLGPTISNRIIEDGGILEIQDQCHRRTK